MVIKFVGAIVLVFSAWTYGWYGTEYIKKRIEELNGVKRALVMFADETQYGAGALWQVFESVAVRSSGFAKKVFEDAGSMLYEKEAQGACFVWMKALENNKKGSFLLEEDIKKLMSFGKSLGFCDSSYQVSNAKSTIDNIDNKMDELRRKLAEEGKLYKSLGVMVGLLAVVVIF